MDVGTQAQRSGVAQLVALARGPEPAAVRAAAWVARCVGRGASAPLSESDLVGLAAVLETRRIPPGGVVFAAGDAPAGVWIVRSGRLELVVGSGRRQVVVRVMRPGDVDGDIQLLLGAPPPYTARARTETVLLHVSPEAFELLGGTLVEQVARLLLDEAVDGVVDLPQRTLAAMLGSRRPSLNKVLGDLQRSGVVETGYRTTRVVDPARLHVLAGRTGGWAGRHPACPPTGLASAGRTGPAARGRAPSGTAAP